MIYEKVKTMTTMKSIISAIFLILLPLAVRADTIDTGDTAWIDEEDPNRLWVLWAGSSPGDYIRVFTALSPAAMM